MTDRLAQLQAAVEAGELEAWIGALAKLWLESANGRQGKHPSAEDLGALLVDPVVLARLEEEAPDGPWDVLTAQARSVRSHGRLGEALRALSDVL